MINIILCGYRTWAINIIDKIKNNPKINIIEIFKSKNEYDLKIFNLKQEPDIILFLGWSWIIPKEITQKYKCLGIHPSDLPHFRGGSPIQHQIIQDVLKTKLTLMTLSNEKLDAGEIWLKESLDLNGDNMNSVFNNIEKSCIKLLNNFFDLYPNINPTKQDLKFGSYYKRRTPKQSEIKLDDFKNKSLEEIYNFIRCLTDPYPNAFMEDSDGNKLIFKGVKFVKNIDKSNEEE